jgi:hypothetical protein
LETEETKRGDGEIMILPPTLLSLENRIASLSPVRAQQRPPGQMGKSRRMRPRTQKKRLSVIYLAEGRLRVCAAACQDERVEMRQAR